MVRCEQSHEFFFFFFFLKRTPIEGVCGGDAGAAGGALRHRVAHVVGAGGVVEEEVYAHFVACAHPAKSDAGGTCAVVDARGGHDVERVEHLGRREARHALRDERKSRSCQNQVTMRVTW